MLVLVSAIKLVCEIALMALLGQWVLGWFAGQGRDTNFFYRLLSILTQPFVKVTRLITPRGVLDRHVPVAAFCLLLGVWMVVTVIKIDLCLQVGVEQCR